MNYALYAETEFSERGKKGEIKGKKNSVVAIPLSIFLYLPVVNNRLITIY